MTVTYEEREIAAQVKSLTDAVRPVLADGSAMIQGASLAVLLGEWLSKQPADARGELIEMHIEAVRDVCELEAEEAA